VHKPSEAISLWISQAHNNRNWLSDLCFDFLDAIFSYFGINILEYQHPFFFCFPAWVIPSFLWG